MVGPNVLLAALFLGGTSLGLLRPSLRLQHRRRFLPNGILRGSGIVYSRTFVMALSSPFSRSWFTLLSIARCWTMRAVSSINRSEEHTSELQSLRHLVCRLLLE